MIIILDNRPLEKLEELEKSQAATLLTQVEIKARQDDQDKVLAELLLKITGGINNV